MAQENTRQYRDYIREVEAAMPTDSMVEIPYEVLRGGKHTPLLATLLFNPYGPTIQTISAMASDDPALPRLILRRDLNPFAQMWQMPVGLLPASTSQPFVSTLNVVAAYLAGNGLGTRVTSRSFLGSWPTAVMVCPLLAHVAPVVATALFDGARSAGLCLDGEEEQARRFGTRLWDRATEDMNRAFARFRTRSESAAAEEDPPEWASFQEWWRLAASREMVEAALSGTRLAWDGAIRHTPLKPEVPTEEASGWVGLFAAAYRRGPRPGDPLPEEAARVEQVCARWPQSQIRPAETGWEVREGDEDEELDREGGAGPSGDLDGKLAEPGRTGVLLAPGTTIEGGRACAGGSRSNGGKG